MARRYDVCTPRPKKDGGTFWVRVGTAFDGENGIGILLDALPIPDAEGRCALRLFEPREHGNAPPRRNDDGPRTGARGGAADLDDEIPF